MLKVKEETSQNASVEINNSYENNMLQQMEQMNMDVQNTPAVDNKDLNKQSWAEIMDNDSVNLKDITNATNSWATPSTNETTLRKSFYNQRGSTLTNGEIEIAQEPIQYFNHEHENMQADITQQEAMAELAEVAINVKTKVAKEEDTHEKVMKTPTNTGASPDEEMAAEPSDPLRDKLLNLYGTTENKKNLPPVAATKDINVEDVQASMFSQVSNAEMDDFKITTKRCMEILRKGSYQNRTAMNMK
ncbi:29024_t:CDS:2, partial [Gigaspora margarita]